jgi:hypothetical protein
VVQNDRDIAELDRAYRMLRCAVSSRVRGWLFDPAPRTTAIILFNSIVHLLGPFADGVRTRPVARRSRGKSEVHVFPFVSARSRGSFGAHHSAAHSAVVPQPRIIPHAAWQVTPPVGHAADATRQNKRVGDSLAFRDLTIGVRSTTVDSSGAKPIDLVQLRLTQSGVSEERLVSEGAAFNWRGYHVAIVAIYGPGELGAGLVALEVATLASVPPEVASSLVAGGAALRLRIPHRITHVTLHHTGDSRPLGPTDDPVARLRGLQSWGAAERNWWVVPFHYLLDLDGDMSATGTSWVKRTQRTIERSFLISSRQLRSAGANPRSWPRSPT